MKILISWYMPQLNVSKASITLEVANKIILNVFGSIFTIKLGIAKKLSLLPITKKIT
jgi:hypothetical protein